MLRTHTCGELTTKDMKKDVILCGWMHSRRDHGRIIFIDLRDRYGFTQIVFDPSAYPKTHKIAEHLNREDVLRIKGEVRVRAKDQVNEKIKTGHIEVLVEELEVINKAVIPPIEVDDRIVAGECARLQYRYIDLRRPIMQHRLEIRHRITQAVRKYFADNDFLEIETPLLVKSTPEGARDYIVPSRVSPGKFYALPQSPQLYKQILMVAGIDRYFQIAKCLRDEDLRADRQPEHTQIDFEMSFVTQEDIRRFVEGLIKHIMKTVFKKDINIPFPVLSYKESMDKYGTDKPDLRFGLELSDVTEIVKNSDFSVFKTVIEKGGIVKCICPEQDIPRNQLDAYIEFSQSIGSNGMAWMKVTDNGLESNIVKYFKHELQKELIKKTGAEKGSTIMFIADKREKCNEILARLRSKLGDDFKLCKKDEFKFCWIVDFPLFKWNEDENRWEPEHHMFTMPKKEFIDHFEKHPETALGDLFDIVLNGTEVGSGSIRISQPELQMRVMKFIGLDEQEAKRRFGFLLEAYKYGAPLHGGMGIGLDRLTALCLGLADIREVIAFPKNKAAECPMDGSPSDASEDQLKELHIRSNIAKKK